MDDESSLNSQLSEKCGVFAIYSSGNEAARLTFYGLWALQHRGQESSGIVSSDGSNLYQHAGSGLVANVYREEDLEQLPGGLAIGHNRYSTSGGADDAHCQPILKKQRQFSLAHNGNLPTTEALQTFLSGHDISYQGLNDSEMMAEAIDYYLSEGNSLKEAIIKAYPLFTGAFSIVILDKGNIYALRDTCGIRPLSIGTLEDGYAVASETSALDTVGAEFLRDVEPGELVIINNQGITSEQITPSNLKLDIFEFVYFARPDSILLGQRVNQVRENFGRQLAKEFKIDADVVIPVPDSGIPAALGYSRASGIPYENGFIKNRYIHRTFIRPSSALRDRDLQMKLNPIVELLKGKRVIVIDDSIVRGTTVRKIVKMIYRAGASEVHVLISSAPVRYPDFYGINTPTQSELIASKMSNEEIRDYLGATSLGYLSYDGTIAATGRPKSDFCTSCFNGEYPISIGTRAHDIVKV